MEMKTAEEMKVITNCAYDNKISIASDVLVESLYGDILREAKKGWSRIDVVVWTRMASEHMSFNDDITQDILKLVREELTALGYFVELRGTGKGQTIAVEW
jgi:hypothetical protein